MAGLSYSAHLSQKNSAINSKAKLSGVAKHNLRKYRSLEYDKENIVILWGTDKLVQDVKKVYKEQFDEAVREYYVSGNDILALYDNSFAVTQNL